MSDPIGTSRSDGFRLLIDGKGHEPMLEVVSDGQGRYTVKSDRIIPRNDQSETPSEMTTDNGHQVIGLVMSFLSALDSGEYLTRRLKERGA